MAEDSQKRLQFLQGLIASLKKIEGEQQTTIEHIAKLQVELQSEKKEALSNKIGDCFTNASNNTQLLHEMIEEFQMEVNKLKAGA